MNQRSLLRLKLQTSKIQHGEPRDVPHNFSFTIAPQELFNMSFGNDKK